MDTGLDLRGGQIQVLCLLNGLREAGHHCELLSRAGSELSARAREDGFLVAAANLQSVFAKSRQFDLVHVHDARAHTLAVLANRTRLVVSRRVAFPLKTNLFSRWKYSRTARYLAVSGFVEGVLLAGGVRNNRIDVVHDAVCHDGREGNWSREYRAVTLASDDPQKGRDLVEQAAQSSGIDVIYSKDLFKDLQRASMFIYATRSEGLGSAALLAMSMGIPVIASRVGGLSEVFEHEVSGLYVENDPRTLARAMRRILADPILARRLIEGGKARVSERFSREQMVAATLASYGRALSD